MINAGIFDGDQVLVKQQSSAENGDMVVALVEDAATVKTFYKEDGYYRLSRKMMRWIQILVHGNLQILGKVFGVFRFIINQIRQKRIPGSCWFSSTASGIRLLIRNYFTNRRILKNLFLMRISF